VRKLIRLLQVAKEMNSLYGFIRFLKSGRRGAVKRKKRPGVFRLFSETASLSHGKKAFYLS
jgi:hypothetical protein